MDAKFAFCAQYDCAGVGATGTSHLLLVADFGNVGSIVAFQVGGSDAKVLAEQFGKYVGQIMPENLTGLPKFTAYARLLIDGMPSNPFSMKTLAPSTNFDAVRAEIIRRVTKRQFSKKTSTAAGVRGRAESAEA